MKEAEKNPKNIWLLGSSSLFNDIGSEMITPILPFYITALGGAGIAVGLLSGLREGLASIFKLLGGWASDRKGKRMPFVFLGYLLSIISRFLLIIAASWQAIIAFVSFERIGKLRDAPRDAIIAQSTKKTGRGFGLHQALDTSGAIIGTIIVIFLFWKIEMQFKTIILIAAAISVFSLLPLFFVKEPKTKPEKKSLFKGLCSLHPKLKYFILVASIFTIANFGLYLFLLLRVRQITGSIIIALLFYLLFNLVWVLFSTPFGNLSDKLGRKKVLMMGYILFLAVSISFIYISNIFYMIIPFIFLGLVYAITQANQRALVADLSGKMKATTIGTYYSITGLVNIPAGLVAGIFWNISYAAMFTYLSIVSLLSIVFLMFVKE